MARGSIVLNSYSWSPKYLDTEGLRYFSNISMYFRVSVVSEVGTRAPTRLEVTQPQNITEMRLFSSFYTKSGLYFSSDFFQISNYRSFPIITMVSSAKKNGFSWIRCPIYFFSAKFYPFLPICSSNDFLQF